jgi:hypothetical protein
VFLAHKNPGPSDEYKYNNASVEEEEEEEEEEYCVGGGDAGVK